MSGISTQISMVDNISTVLHTISNSLNSVNSAFESVYNTAANDINTVGFESVRAQIEAATASTEQLQEQLRETANISWDNLERIEIFQNTGIDRYNKEMQSLTSIANGFLQRQAQIGQQALNMELLPPNAITDITAANQRLEQLGQQMAAMQSIDTSMLDDAAITRLNAEYEGMRGSLTDLINLQENMNTAIEAGDLSRLNAGYNQLNDGAEAFEKRIRDNTAALQEMANIEWASPQNIEIFSGDSFERWRQEIASSNEMMNQLTITQQAISQQAASMNLLPPNALQDIDGMGNRIENLRKQIDQVQQSRISVVGVEQANREVEQLRQQLNNALHTQEDMNAALGNMDVSGANRAYQQLNTIISDTERNIRDNVNEQKDFNEQIRNGERAANGLKTVLAGVIGVFSARAATNWVRGSVDAANQQIVAEQQLANVLANQGASYEEFLTLKERANAMQDETMYSGTSMIGGAAELSTYISDVEALQSMMGTLANYAAGMSGGAEVGYQEMVNYATQLGKALDGTYDGLAKKGFVLSDAQKEIIENGTEMERALVIDAVINQSWADLAEQMANTPQGMMTSVKNAFDSIQTSIGTQLLPVVLMLFTTIQGHLPQIEQMLQGLAPVIEFIVQLIGEIINVAFGVYDAIVSNWSMIAPIILAVAAALLICVGVMTVYNTVQAIAAVMASILACSITWIFIAIIALIAAIYLGVAAFNKIADTSVSATGLIFGAFAWLGSVVANIFMGLLELILGVINFLVNPFIDFANFIGNVFTNPVSSVIYLFQGMADTVLALLQKIASALDFVFGSNMADTIAGWRAGLKDLADAAVAEYAPNENYQKVMDELDLSVSNTLGWERFSNVEAFNAGYALGESIEDSFSSFDPASLFDSNIPTADDYVTFNNDAADYLADIANNTADTASNTANIASNTAEISEENLKYWRDIAERDAINRYTTAKVDVQFKGGIHNTVSSNMDLDGIITYISDGVEEAVEITAERTVYA